MKTKVQIMDINRNKKARGWRIFGKENKNELFEKGAKYVFIQCKIDTQIATICNEIIWEKLIKIEYPTRWKWVIDHPFILETTCWRNEVKRMIERREKFRNIYDCIKNKHKYIYLYPSGGDIKNITLKKGFFYPEDWYIVINSFDICAMLVEIFKIFGETLDLYKINNLQMLSLKI